MNNQEFSEIFFERQELCNNVLIKKAEEYANDHDRLWNFKQAASLNNSTPEQACWAFLTKHLISIADMVRDEGVTRHYTQEAWDEKIGDALNYLFLLDAIIKETDRPKKNLS